MEATVPLPPSMPPPDRDSAEGLIRDLAMALGRWLPSPAAAAERRSETVSEWAAKDNATLDKALTYTQPQPVDHSAALADALRDALHLLGWYKQNSPGLRLVGGPGPVPWTASDEQTMAKGKTALDAYEAATARVPA